MEHLRDALAPVLKNKKKTMGFYCGGMKKHDLMETLEKDIIIATYHMAAEAFDCAKLNTLVLASSKTDIEQSVGRILRKNHQDIKPVIIDICDKDHGVFANQAIKRRRYYKKCGYTVYKNGEIVVTRKQATQCKIPQIKSEEEDAQCLI